MAAVLQSGSVTPGHNVIWTTDGVVQDGGAGPAAQRVLGSLRGANFNTTADQPIAIPQRITAFQLTGIIVTNADPVTSAIGGFYPAAGKTGTPIVSAAQSYAALSSAAALLSCTLASFGANTRFSSVNLGQIGGLLQIWFSLTVAEGVPGAADIYLMGVDLT